ncbi:MULTISPECIES: OmpH family outer membrane protein [unclassified Desulfovibrio]|uniref:OmpH family outer membrane protein n=1 Tax=unclassified Desulfovibrio TaxID=2593640 RepID=UPI002FD99A03
MRIRYFMPLALLLSLMLIACQQGEGSSQAKLAVVDMTRVMRDSEAGKAGVKHLEGLQADMQAQLNNIQKRLEQNADDADAQKELQTVYMASQQRMQVEQQNVVNVLYDTMQRIINAYRADKGYALIISSEAAASFDPKADVTSDIIAAMDKQKIDFKPAGEAEKAPEAEAAKPADKAAEKPADKSADKADKPAKADKK